MSASHNDTLLNEIIFVAFDTETTGLSPAAARLLEVSGVKFKINAKVSSTFSQLINPEIDIPVDVTAIHGIDNTMVRDKPTYKQVIPEFLQWIGNDEVVLVAHNAPFDLGFLEISIAKLGLPTPGCKIIDTLPLSRRLLPKAPNHQLSTLISYLKLETGEYHRALADSHHVRNLLNTLIEIMGAPNTFGQLASQCELLNFNNRTEEGLQQLQSLPIEFKSLQKAIDNQLPISIVYDSYNKESRVVTPYSVHTWRGNVYLSAYCHLVQAERTFRFDKIVKLELLGG